MILKKNEQGFTFIELFVVVFIVAILSAIAVPLYQESVIESYAPEGKAVLSSISAAAQRYRVYNGNSFSGLTLATLTAAPYNVMTNATDKWNFEITSADTNTFTVKATGTGKVPSSRTITLVFDVNATPQETFTENW
jgi:type IV pilus assembly protein PilE